MTSVRRSADNQPAGNQAIEVFSKESDSLVYAFVFGYCFIFLVHNSRTRLLYF